MKETDRQLPSQLIMLESNKVLRVVGGFVSLQSIISKVMKAENKRKAVEMYEDGWSLTSIRSSCGDDVEFYKIKRWRWKLSKGMSLYDDRPKSAKKDYKLLKGKKGKKTKKRWKKRVFAGWQDTPEQAAFRRSLEYQQWRITVLERDKYTCQHCEQTGGRLVVHHIKTFKMYPELRLELDNGIVLCNDCHEKLHLSRVKKPKILKFG